MSDFRRDLAAAALIVALFIGSLLGGLALYDHADAVWIAQHPVIGSGK